MKNAKMPITAISEMKNIIHEVPLVHTALTLSEGHTHASPLPINTTTSTSSTSGTTYPCLSVAVVRLVGKLNLLPKTFKLLVNDPEESQRPLNFVMF